MTQYGIRPPSLKPVTRSSSASSTTPNGEAGRATVTVAAAPVSRCRSSSAVEVDVDELVAVQREDVALLVPLPRRELDPAAPAERARAPRRRRSRRRARPAPPSNSAPWPAAQRDDHALDARGREPSDLVRGERPAGDVDERLRPPAAGVAEALGLAARQDDRLHYSLRSSRSGSGVSGSEANGEAARPIPS